jgi:hypothetical protein
VGPNLGPQHRWRLQYASELALFLPTKKFVQISHLEKIIRNWRIIIFKAASRNREKSALLYT